MKSNIPDPTIRDTTQNNNYLGVMGTAWKRGQAFDMKTNIPDPTIRDTTQNNNYIGVMGTEWKRGQAFDMKLNIPDPTIRDTTQNNNYIGVMGTEWKRGQAFDMKTNIPDPTIRDTTQNNNYNGHVYGTYNKHIGFDYKSNVPDPTMRDTTQNKSYMGPLGDKNNMRGGYLAAEKGTIAKPTLRLLTENNNHLNPAYFVNKERVREDANNSKVNIMKDMVTKIRDGGAPTPSNYEKGPMYDYTMVQLCEPTQVKRDLYGNMEGQRPLQCVPTNYTRVKNGLPEESWRFDTCVVDSLKTNPFINNTQHKSVEY